MDDRRQERRPQDEDFGTGRSVATQERQGSEASRWQGSGGGAGDWQGYIVPYRYYGPGYRGVGYYSVMYQGPGENGGGQDEMAEPGGTGQRAQTGYGRGGYEQGRYGQLRSGPSDYWQSGFGRSGYGDEAWSQRGRSGQGGFAGRGPKGYQRSDERLRDEVSDRLMEHDQLDASDIEVQVKDGEVMLTGTVADRWMKRLAEDVAEQVMGVRDVMNQIRVRDEPTDADDVRSRSGTTTGTRSTGSTGSSRRSSGSTSQRSGGSTSRSSTRSRAQASPEDVTGNGQTGPTPSTTR